MHILCGSDNPVKVEEQNTGTLYPYQFDFIPML